MGLLFAFILGGAIGGSIESGRPTSIKQDVAYQTVAQEGRYAALKQVGSMVLRAYYLENEATLPPCFITTWKKEIEVVIEIGCPK